MRAPRLPELVLLAGTVCLAACGLPQNPQAVLVKNPTPQAYVAAANGRATLVPDGKYVLAGRTMRCAGSPTVLDSGFNDYAAAHPKFIIINPSLLNKEPVPVKLWVYARECRHVERGWDLEQGATRADTDAVDCYGVKKGRREGWLTPKGLDQICTFIAPGRADPMHRSGPERCAAMRKCYAKAA